MMGPSHPMWVHPQVTIARLFCQQLQLAQVPSFQLPQLPPVGGPTKFHPISIREGQKEHVRTCIITYVYSPCIYIYIHTQRYICLVHTYIYIYIHIYRHTIVTIKQDLSLQAALPSLQQRALWCSPWVSGKNPKIWPMDSRCQETAPVNFESLLCRESMGKHVGKHGWCRLMPIDANWCYVFFGFPLDTPISRPKKLYILGFPGASRGRSWVCPLFEKIEMANGQDSRHEITWVAMVGSLGHEPK